MSQYKVLPPYSEINTINTEYEKDNSFVNFSLSYRSDDTARLGAGGQDQQVSIKKWKNIVNLSTYSKA
jgi:hypothetical protein